MPSISAWALLLLWRFSLAWSSELGFDCVAEGATCLIACRYLESGTSTFGKLTHTTEDHAVYLCLGPAAALEVLSCLEL